MASYNVIGKRVPRIEGVAKVTGETIYSGDIQLRGLLHAKVLRSSLAHARIKRIDLSRARALPGVFGVYTQKDLVEGLHVDSSSRALTLLATDEVLYYGQPLVVALASEASLAEEALALVELELQELPAVVDPLLAMRPDAPPVRSPVGAVDRSEEAAHLTMDETGAEVSSSAVNVSQRVVYSRGDVEKGFAEADLVLERRWRASMVHQGYIEPHVAVVDYDASGDFTVWTSTQGPFRVREELAHLLQVPEAKINVAVSELGGGFGGKNNPFDAAVAAALARKSRHPVKLAMSRSEDLRAGNPAPQAIVDLKTGVTKDGRLTALKATVMFDAGAYPGGPTMGGSNLMGSYYKWPNLEIEGVEVMTNKVSVGALRAPGIPQVTFAMESQMELMARELGMDSVDFRLRNAVEGGDLMPNGRPLATIGLKECLNKLAQTEFWQRRGQKEPNEGIGIAVGGWLGGVSPASSLATFNTDGTVNIVVGAADISGVNTSFSQIAAEVLGLPLDRVFVQQADTASGPYAGISAGSKTLRTVGMAVRAAAEDMRDQLFQLVAERLECNPGDLESVNGEIRVKGSPERALSFAMLASMTTGFGARYALVVGKGSTASPSQAPSFSVQGVRVYVDPDTGEVSIREAVCIQDVGLAINPLSVEGQIQGGATQSIAIGMMEELQYDERGILRNPTLLDYRMPTALDLPRIQGMFIEVPGKESELWGARGVGEPSIIAGATAVANAVADATGARVDMMPVTAERILRALGKVATP